MFRDIVEAKAKEVQGHIAGYNAAGTVAQIVYNGLKNSMIIELLNGEIKITKI